MISMKNWVYSLIILLVLPIVFAELSITSDSPEYNLGDQISISGKVSDYSFEGLVEASIECEDFTLEYFKLPVTIDAQDELAFPIPKINSGVRFW